MNAAVPGVASYASRAPFPEFGQLQVVAGEGTGNYNSFGIKLTRRLSGGLTALVSYTWSRALDTASAIRGNANDIFPQNSHCLDCEYGPSAFNTPHRFVTSAIYELPFGRGKVLLNTGGFVNQVVGGWQIGSIIAAQSGRPVNTQTYDAPTRGLFGETRLNATGVDPYLPASQRSADQWFNFAGLLKSVAGDIRQSRQDGADRSGHIRVGRVVHQELRDP